MNNILLKANHCNSRKKNKDYDPNKTTAIVGIYYMEDQVT